MANRNNSGRTKKSHGFRPYDSSNSFVKRITDKVSEILPQPTSWVSRWFSPASKLNTRGHDEVDEDDDEEEERQPPPSKRLCFGTSETSDFSHQNNINRLSDLGRGSGEISPILSRSDEERPVAGPSGLHLRHFVASTPAIRHATPSPSKVNLREKARDDASDESETTSGCSSLVPGAERPHTQLSTPTPPSPTARPNPSTIRRLSSNTLKPTSFLNRTTSMNLSTSSQPSFDTYVFNNPLNRSGFRRTSIGDESCFYPGQTTFGGSSSRLSATVDQTRVVSVKASPTSQLQQDTIGTSALRILRALQQFSTPVLDAKRIPVRRDGASSERKRKAPQPYEELIYPSMPDLLRVKRREQELERTRVGVGPNRDGPASTPLQPPPPKPTAVPTTSSTTPLTVSPHLPSSSRSTSTYSLRPENSSKERHIGSIKGRNKDEDFELERVPEVNLPNVKLQLSSLPKFDLNVPSPQPKASTQSNSPSASKNPPFKFSEPEVPKIQPSKENKILPVDTFKFSEPLEPLELKNKSVPVNRTNEKLSSPMPQMKNPSPVMKLKRKLPESQPEILSNFKFEVKPATEMKNASVMEVLSKQPFGGNLKSSIEDWTCSGCNAKNSSNQSKCLPCGRAKSGKEAASSLMSTWDCKKCSLKNSFPETKCKSCGLDKNETPSSTTSKGFEGFKKPKDTWECSSCLVNNKNLVDICVACSTPKSSSVTSSKSSTDSSVAKPQDKKVNDVGSTTAGTPFQFNSLKAKTPAGTWECNTCLVRNKSDDNKCVACSALKPGSSATLEKPKPTFSFGIPPSSTNEVKPFNALSSSQGSTTQPQFTFGIPQDAKGSVTSTNLKAGSENKSEVVTSADSTTTVSSSVVSSTPAPLVNSFKKPEGCWECSTCLVQNKKDSTSCVACNTLKPGATPAEKPKPTFSFGIPSSSTMVTNSPITFGTSTSANNETVSNLNSKPQFTFGSTSDDKKTSTTLFGFPSTESKPSNDLKAASELKPFSFMNSDQSKEKGTTKAPMTNLFSFGSTNKESKSEEMNDECDDKPPKKKVSFGNPLTFEKQNANENSSVTFGNIGATKTNEISSSSNFAFTPFENNSSIKKDNAPNSNSLFTFGSTSNSVTNPNNICVAEPTKPATFGGLSSEKNPSVGSQLPNSNTIFGSSTLGFKAPESENKPFAFMSNATQSSNQQSGGFTFNPPANASSELSSQPKEVVSGPSLFSQQQASTPVTIFTQPQEQKPFVFNAPPTQPQLQPQQPSSLFSFTPAPAQSGGLGSMQFGSFSTPSTPKFDPNIKPSFNFTGGATPSFSASPTPNSLEVGGDNKRKVRKAIRRTTLHR